MQHRKIFQILIVNCCFLAILLSGCSFDGCPRPRLGSYASDTPGTNFIDGRHIGKHNYANCISEGNGIVYTCRGGHIDITHLRIAADYTKYLTDITKEHLCDNKSDFSYKLNVEPSVYYAKLEYPADWDDLNEQEKNHIIDELSLELGQYLTFKMTTWHEILTWYGYKCMWILPETPSAFSWEDIYSNLLGTRLAAQAIADTAHNYDEAMTIAINNELEFLGLQSANTAKKAAAKMNNKWYKGLVLVDMKQRNMDTGLDDGYVSPMLTGDMPQCPDVQPQPYPAPTLEKFTAYGFTIKVEIEPREFEKDKILKLVYPEGSGKRIDIQNHLPIILDAVKKEAIDKGYNTMPY